MKATIKAVIGLCVALALTLGLASTAVAAPAASDGPATVGNVALVQFAGEYQARDAAPARPAKSERPLYKYSGLHWADSRIPVPYVVNDRDTNGYLQGLQDSFATWEADEQSYISFVCANPAWTGTPSSFVGSGTSNGVNEVGWASLTKSYPNAIAVTMIWYGRDKHIVEIDTAMNSDFDWVQNAVTGDPDTQNGAPGYYDVQDIMTHEAGHWLVLNDLYTAGASEQTMYGYGWTGELKARSLESGDIAGLRKVYPGATMP